MKNIRYLFGLVLRWTAISLAISVLSRLVAGSMPSPSLRHYLSLLSSLLGFAMLSVRPQLYRERSQTIYPCCSWQRIATGMYFLFIVLTAAWDVGRLHMLDSVPASIRGTFLLMFALVMTLQIWAMAVNPFFSPEVRIQSDQRLIAAGPYRITRHPGYVAMLVAGPASAISIGSWLALLPAALFCAAILKRVQTEDNFLQNNLAGYREYAQTVSKFLPRIPRLSHFLFRSGSFLPKA